MDRNAYVWMAKPRLRGYKKDARQTWSTEFDRWLRVMDISVREAAELLDLPEQRIRDLKSGWRNGQLNGAMVPSFITRYAMAAALNELRPVAPDPECWDKVVRLGQAAFNAGLEPWPEGERFLTNPADRRAKVGKLRLEPLKVKKRKPPGPQKRKLVPKDPAYR